MTLLFNLKYPGPRGCLSIIRLKNTREWSDRKPVVILQFLMILTKLLETRK